GAGADPGLRPTFEIVLDPFRIASRTPRRVAEPLRLEAVGLVGMARENVPAEFPGVGDGGSEHSDTHHSASRDIRWSSAGPRCWRSQTNQAKASADDARGPFQPARCIMGRRSRNT